ncbi:hypothetical protein VIGAN_06124600 [Vigna angularis var. angularis]|uniref:Uncharacterized protein n=1 Tax=Vigna angularis var. angularis TaxID=157739 RepID=A0A0S3SB78_PHAAN|nr:hypothetical protein VIGAN_06124600 [Vigna angularis var. angularis]
MEHMPHGHSFWQQNTYLKGPHICKEIWQGFHVKVEKFCTMNDLIGRHHSQHFGLGCADFFSSSTPHKAHGFLHPRAQHEAKFSRGVHGPHGKGK